MFEKFNYCFDKYKHWQYLKTDEYKEMKRKYWEIYWLKVKVWDRWDVTIIYSWLHINVLKYVFENYFVKEFSTKYTQQQFEAFKKKLWRITNYYRLDLLLKAYFHNIKVWMVDWKRTVLNAKEIRIWALRIEISRKLTEFKIPWKKEFLDLFDIDSFYQRYQITI